jgi:hypothetical protein
MRFEALQNFHSPEMGSSYCTGLKYTVRPGNEKLAEMVSKWEDEKLVRVIREVSVRATVTAIGKVG